MPKKILKGGDGYVVNVNEPIGGKPAYSRYSYNYAPIFEGDLLQNGGDGYSFDVNENIGGLAQVNKYTYRNAPIFEGDLLQNGGCKNCKKIIKGGCECDNCKKVMRGGGNCGCTGSAPNDNPPIFELIKQAGGGEKKSKNINQFYAINELAHILQPLNMKSLVDLNLELFLNNLHKTKPNKAKQFGGNINSLQEIIAPLGKQNLLVLASLLLLHHFAVESQPNTKLENKQVHHKMTILKGGANETLTSILSPLGINQFGACVILVILQQAFTKNTKETKEINSKKQSGGNNLINLIAPLGKNAFIATGLLIVIERLFSNKIKNIKNEKVGGSKNSDELFNLIAPITFNTFAKKDFINKYVKYQEKNKLINK